VSVKMVVFKLHLDDYIHRAVSILQIRSIPSYHGWCLSFVLRSPSLLTIACHSAVRERTDDDISV
jgi:hypothetical protein